MVPDVPADAWPAGEDLRNLRDFDFDLGSLGELGRVQVLVELDILLEQGAFAGVLQRVLLLFNFAFFAVVAIELCVEYCE